MSDFGRISDYSLNHGITLLDKQSTPELAPAARPRGVDASPIEMIDERSGSNSDRELDQWLLADLRRDPELELPVAFNTAFDGCRHNLRDWLVNDRGTKPESTRTIKQTERLLGEVRANLDLVHYYMTAIFKG
jgi:hypothetical protein